jgi:RNA polymerase sigma-70 factor, ECF subfamily
MDDVESELQELYEAFRPRIQRYLGRLVSQSEAEDLTQEVFVKVHQALPGFRGDSKISTWLYRIATNAALDRLRSSTAHRVDAEDPDAEGTGDTEDQNPWTGESPPSVESQVAFQAMNDCIREFILGLPESYRTVLVLRDLEGLQDREIAEVLGVSLQAAKIRVHRARERLKRDLEARCELSWREGDDSPPCAKKPPAKPVDPK